MKTITANLMFNSRHRVRPSVALLCVAYLIPASSGLCAATLYESNFDSLSLGLTQSFPGDAGQDGWYRSSAVGAAYGEFQNAIANGGRALHEFAPATNQSRLQTIDARPLGGVDVSESTTLTLSVDFYAHSSDLSQVNNYLAGLYVVGTTTATESVGTVIAIDLGGGNGSPKSATGLTVGLGYFNGVSNNDPIPLTVGQQLSWNSWHSISISLSPAADRYIALTVDGLTQDLSGFQSPRTFDGAAWQPIKVADSLIAQILPDDVGGTLTNDDVYWDNLSITAVPEPAAMPLEIIASGCCALVAYRVRRAPGRLGGWPCDPNGFCTES